MIVAVIGLPGSGKSYFAKRLADTIGGEYINSDRLRKELFPKPAYTRAEKASVYGVMIQKMRDAIRHNRHVVLDATFHKKESRDLLLKSTGHSIRFIEIRAGESVIEERLKKARPYSDADFGVYRLIKEEWEGMEEPHLILESTNENIEIMLKTAIQYLRNDTGTNQGFDLRGSLP